MCYWDVIGIKVAMD